MIHCIRLTTVVFLLGMIGGCGLSDQSVDVPSVKIATQDLLLRPTAFVGAWTHSPPEYDDDYLEDDFETFSTQFVRELPYPNIATERISRFATPEDARIILAGFVQGDNTPSGFPYHRQLTYPSQIANQQVLLCAYNQPPPDGPNPRSAFCNVYAQYGTYVVQFSAYVDDHSLSYTDFERILQAIDRQMEQILSN